MSAQKLPKSQKIQACSFSSLGKSRTYNPEAELVQTKLIIALLFIATVNLAVVNKYFQTCLRRCFDCALVAIDCDKTAGVKWL